MIRQIVRISTPQVLLHSKFKIRDDGQVIGRQYGPSASVKRRTLERERLIKVNMIQMEDRSDAGEGAHGAEVQLWIDTLEFRFEKTSCQSAYPFVKVAGYHSPPNDGRVIEDAIR